MFIFFSYVGRPETDMLRKAAMNQLGLGLYQTGHYEDALPVQEAELAMERRHGISEHNMLITQGNLALTYKALGRLESALSMNRDVFLGFLKLYGEEHGSTLLAADNYASTLSSLERYGEASKLLRKLTPAARRFLGEGNETTLRMRWTFGEALYKDDGATLDDLREAVDTYEDTERTARRVFGGAHPFTVDMEANLRKARAVLRAREETPPGDV